MLFQSNKGRRGIDELRKGLLETNPIIYRENGCRSVLAEEFLPRALEVGKKIGVTRLASISQLSDIDYPVVQSTRPHIFDHINAAMNTGSQGKGPSLTQATISCLMESLEAYAMETRDPRLIRGSFAELSKSYVVLDPEFCVLAFNADECKKDEAILWTDSYCPDLDCTVLVPAESVYFPMKAESYQTAHHFQRGYNGLAAGATYLDATIHGLYELIERRLKAETERGTAPSYEVSLESCPSLKKLSAALDGRAKVQLFFVKSKELPEIPYFEAKIETSQSRIHHGYGCCLDVDIAMERALSEAVQTQATVDSTSREDMVHQFKDSRFYKDKIFFAKAFSVWHHNKNKAHHYAHAPRPYFKKILPIEILKEMTGHAKYTSLQEEYSLLKNWMAKAGFPLHYICNMTPIGIDIPVVRVLVPNMCPSEAFLSPRNPTAKNIDRWKYRTVVQKKLQKWHRTHSRVDS